MDRAEQWRKTALSFELRAMRVEYVLRLLVAAGHVTQAKVDEALNLARHFKPAPGVPVAWRWRSKDASGIWGDWHHGDWKPQGPASPAFEVQALGVVPDGVPVVPEPFGQEVYEARQRGGGGWEVVDSKTADILIDSDEWEVRRLIVVPYRPPTLGGAPSAAPEQPGPLLTFSLAYMDGVMEGENEEVRRHWQRVRAYVAGVEGKRNG